MTIAPISIVHRLPVINDVSRALDDFNVWLGYLAGTAEDNTHDLWDLLDSPAFRLGTETDLGRDLRARIVKLAMRQTVTSEALNDRLHILQAIVEAVPVSDGEAA